jgi:hypothetical protein
MKSGSDEAKIHSEKLEKMRLEECAGHSVQRNLRLECRTSGAYIK